MRWTLLALGAAFAALVLAGAGTSLGQQTSRQQVSIPATVSTPPGGIVEFVPATEPRIGRNVTVENRSGQQATISLTSDGTLTVSLPPGYQVELSDFLETTPSCTRVDPATIRCTNVFAPAGQFVTITASRAATPTSTATATATPTPTPRAMEQVPLAAGCNNVALTWPAGTPLSTVAGSVAPAGALESIFRYDAAANRYFGYSPAAPAFVNDYTTVMSSLEPVFICMRAPGTLSRPAV